MKTPTKNAKETKITKNQKCTKDNTATRIIIILKNLYDGAVISVEELASEFSTSVRTIQRDLQTIARHLPLQHQGGVYEIDALSLNRRGGGGEPQIHKEICHH